MKVHRINRFYFSFITITKGPFYIRIDVASNLPVGKLRCSIVFAYNENIWITLRFSSYNSCSICPNWLLSSNYCCCCPYYPYYDYYCCGCCLSIRADGENLSWSRHLLPLGYRVDRSWLWDNRGETSPPYLWYLTWPRIWPTISIQGERVSHPWLRSGRE